MAHNAFEEFFVGDLKDPALRRQYDQTRSQIDAIDSLIRALDQRRRQRRWTKAELARQAGLNPALVRRLFSQQLPNPTMQTIMALANALDVRVTVLASDAVNDVTDETAQDPLTAPVAR